MTPAQELRWLYRNMTPQLRQLIRPSDFWDVFCLSQRVRETERLLLEVKQVETCGLRLPTVSSGLENTPENRDRQYSRYSPTNRSRQNELRQQNRTGPPLSRNREYQPPARAPNRVDSRPNVREITAEPVCWRCGETGHFRFDCTRPPRLFCSRCGKQGVQSRHCSCGRSEN